MTRPADDVQWQLLVRMHVDCDDWSVVWHCLTTLQTMFMGVIFVLRRASDTQRVHDLAAESNNVILYQIEMPCGCLEVSHQNSDA